MPYVRDYCFRVSTHFRLFGLAEADRGRRPSPCQASLAIRLDGWMKKYGFRAYLRIAALCSSPWTYSVIKEPFPFLSYDNPVTSLRRHPLAPTNLLPRLY
jgi:hypothetical protein